MAWAETKAHLDRYQLPKLPDDDPKYHEHLQRAVREAIEKHYETLEVLTTFCIIHGLDPRSLHLYQRSLPDGGNVYYFSHPRLEAEAPDPAATGATGGVGVPGHPPALPPPDGG